MSTLVKCTLPLQPCMHKIISYFVYIFQIEDYNIEVTTHGYDNDYEVSDDDNGIFDNDRI